MLRRELETSSRIGQRGNRAASRSLLLDLVGLREELQELVGRDVDLVEERALKNPFRRARILSEKQVLLAA